MLKEDGSYVSKGDFLCEKLVKDFIASASAFTISSFENPKN